MPEEKTIHSLVEDIYAVVDDRGGWDATLSKFVADEVHDLFERRLSDEVEEQEPSLRMSNIGGPCKRKLWYLVNTPNDGDKLPAKAKLKFLYGDILEVLLISLAMAAGHNVRGTQTELHLAGIRGHRDCVIDGVTVDVKSASPYSFQKFSNGGLRDDDPFGYMRQLSAYVAAGHRDDDTIHPTTGAFLVINKVSGELCLDLHSFPPQELEALPDEFERTKAIINSSTIPPRGFEEVPDGYKAKGVFKPNGNKVLGVNCSYCEFKEKCWPGLRTFMYKKGTDYAPKFFTHVEKEPNVLEAK